MRRADSPPPARAAAGVAGVEVIRENFPALRREEGGSPVAYFDGPGGTQIPLQVAEATSRYLLHHNANTHWAYPTSAETDEELAAARSALADFLGCAAEELVFGANMTTLTFHLARGLGRSMAPGDEVVVTELDHHANVDPWVDLARERGLTVRKVRMQPESGTLDWEDFARKLGERTRLVALGAASNALGTVNPLREAVAASHAAGALVFIDAVHSVPHLPTNVRELDCDLLACSPYKFYGPHIGVLYGKRSLLQAVQVPKLLPVSDESPERIETGTLNHEGIVGAAAAVDFLASLAQGENRRARLTVSLTELHRRGEELTAHLWNGLAALDGVQLYGPPPGEPRTSTVAFTVGDLDAREVAAELAREALFLSHGDFYATTVVERLGLAHRGGLVRAGCACYTTEKEVDRLLAAVARLA